MELLVPDQELLSAIQLIQNDEASRQVFKLIKERVTAPGWAIAHTLNKSPDDAQKILDGLKSKGIAKSDGGPGLDGYFFLTSLGFQVAGELQQSV